MSGGTLARVLPGPRPGLPSPPPLPRWPEPSSTGRRHIPGRPVPLRGNRSCAAGGGGFRGRPTPDPVYRGGDTGWLRAGCGVRALDQAASAPSSSPPATRPAPSPGREGSPPRGGGGRGLDQGHGDAGAGGGRALSPRPRGRSLPLPSCGTSRLKRNWKSIFFYFVVFTFQGSNFRI